MLQVGRVFCRIGPLPEDLEPDSDGGSMGWRRILLLGCVLGTVGCQPPNPDSDGDGVPLSDDCDDSDARVYPGAIDSCYDGLDQDCIGGDRIDCDGDGQPPPGSGGNDCDDTSSAVYPGAVDLPYDGIDQDCSGSDQNDQDGDGVPSSRVPGGSDCNDFESTIYPGATELAHDGIDQDCSGGDLLDGDGDGFNAAFAGGSDCDDADAEIHPGAPEIAYDDIDQDCDAFDLVDVDSDGVPGTKAGGTDCDEASPAIYPGADELPYDGIDQDCDGTDLADVDGDGAPWPSDCDDTSSAISPLLSDLACNGIDENCDSLLADQDCDGQDGLDLGGTDCSDQDEAVFLGALESIDTLDNDCDGVIDEPMSASDAHEVLNAQLGGWGDAVAVADLSGDGWPELILAAPGWMESSNYAPGAVFILDGSPSGFSNLTVSGLEAAHRIEGRASGDRFGERLAVGDIDGDGVDDLAVGAPSASSQNGPAGAFYVFSGAEGAWRGRSGADNATGSVLGLSSGDQLGASLAVLPTSTSGPGGVLVGAPGVDGDHLDGGALYLFLASALDGSAMADAAVQTRLGAETGARLGATLAFLGDINADGWQDAAAGAPGTGGGDGAVWLFFGAGDALPLSFGAVHLYADASLDDAGSLGPVARAGDLNGDGLSDLVLAAPDAGGEARGRVFVLFGRAGAWPESLDVSSKAEGIFVGTENDQRLGASLAAGDVDGDGLSDLLLQGDARGLGHASLVFGFAANRWGTTLISSADVSWAGDDEHVLAPGGCVAPLNPGSSADIILRTLPSLDALGAPEQRLIFQW